MLLIVAAKGWVRLRSPREQPDARSAARVPDAPCPDQAKARRIARALVSDVRMRQGDAIARLARLGKEILPRSGLDPDPSVAADQKAVREAVEEARRELQSRGSTEWQAVFEEELATLYCHKLSSPG